MRQPTFKCTCSVCGEGGVGSINTAGAGWYAASQLAHENPNVCRQNLERRAKALEEKESK